MVKIANNINLTIPVKGKVMPLTDVNDYLFNKKIMGEGCAIIPEDNFLYSPVDGKVAMIYDSRHALAIETEDGLKILIHVGIDTVKLEGRAFATYVKAGDKVKQGDKILFFDREYIEKQASTVIPIVIINPELTNDININFRASKVGDTLINVELK